MKERSEDKFKYRNRNFWCRGYYVDTAGKDAKKIQKYIQDQLKEDEVRRQGDESLFSITNEWLKARVFGEVPKRLQGARSTKQKNDRFTESF